jgi:hypothetical protein
MGTLTLTDVANGTTTNPVTNLNDNWSAIETVLNGSVDATNLGSEVVGGAKLTDDVVGAYRTVHHVSAFNAAMGADIPYFFSSSGELHAESIDAAAAADIFWLDDADYAMSGRTAKFRFRGQIVTNGTAPGVTFTSGLYPVLPAFATPNLLDMDLGTVVAGSTIFFNPIQNQAMSSLTADFSLPSDSYYCFAVVASGAIAANAAFGLSLQLQQRWT